MVLNIVLGNGSVLHKQAHSFALHSETSLNYPDPTYPDYSLIRTHVLEPIMIVYIESDSLIQKV